MKLFVLRLLVVFILMNSVVFAASNNDKTILEKFSHKEDVLSQKSLHYIEHNPEVAQKLFLQKCTKCHTEKKALSLKTYKIWKDGLLYMHDKPEKWLNDKDAKLIFLHLLIHLEPDIVNTILKSRKSEKRINWWIFFTYFTGILTIIFMLITFAIAWHKKLRKKYFKKHRYFAQITVALSIIHGLYSFYIFVLR